jgi:hypothetical protein
MGFCKRGLLDLPYPFAKISAMVFIVINRRSDLFGKSVFVKKEGACQPTSYIRGGIGLECEVISARNRSTSFTSGGRIG